MKPTTILLFMTLTTSVIGSCQTGIEPAECPDTSFSQTNLDTLEAKNPKFIWRVCNANEDYAMENVVVPQENPLVIGTLEPCECSMYVGTDLALGDLEYYQGGEEYRFIYLTNYWAVKGLAETLP